MLAVSGVHRQEGAHRYYPSNTDSLEHWQTYNDAEFPKTVQCNPTSKKQQYIATTKHMIIDFK